MKKKEIEMINRRIKSRMILKGISKGTLANYLDFSYDALRRRLIGEVSWNDTEIILLGKILDTSTDYLLKGE